MRSFFMTADGSAEMTKEASCTSTTWTFRHSCAGGKFNSQYHGWYDCACIWAIPTSAKKKAFIIDATWEIFSVQI